MAKLPLNGRLVHNAAAGAAAAPSRATPGLAEDALPADVGRVLRGLVLRMYGHGGGNQEGEGLTFAPGLAEKLREPEFDYRGFLPRITVTDYASPEGWPVNRTVRGVFEFGDPIGRRTSVAYMVRYQLGDGGASLAVDDVRLETQIAAKPRVQMLLVPGAYAQSRLSRAWRSFQDLFAFALKKAVRLDRPARLSADPQSFYILLFFQDRMAPEARITFGAASGATGDEEFNQELNSGQYDGVWVALTSAWFAPRRRKTLSFDVRVAATGGTPVTVGRFEIGLRASPGRVTRPVVPPPLRKGARR